MTRMALQGVLRPNPKTGLYMADQMKARRVLIEWFRALAEGQETNLHELAKANHTSLRRLKIVLKKDEALKDAVLGGLTQEAQLGLTAALARGFRYVQETESDVKEVRQWAEFFAKFSGGGFDAKNRPPVLILQQLLPDLPPTARSVQARVLDDDTGDDYSKLTGGE